MYYSNAYIWHLERWYWLIYLQGSSGETDTENRLTNTREEKEGEGEMYRESNMKTYITICKIENHWNLLYDLGKQNWGSVIT